MSEPQPQTGKRTAPIEMTVLAALVVIFLITSLIAQFVRVDRGATWGFYLTWGDTVRLKSGELKRGKIVGEDEKTITLNVSDSTLTIDRAQIASMSKNAPVESFGIILAAGLTLVMYSFLYRDNALFKAAENLYVGVSLGYGAILTWRESLRPEVYDPFFHSPTAGAFWNSALHRAVPIILGLLLLTRLSRKHSWLSRYAYALMIGFGSGMAIPLTVHSYILKQLYAAVAPFQDAAALQAGGVFSWPWFFNAALAILGAVVVMVGTAAVLFYFFFSIEHKRGGAVFSRVGILFLMVAFGASFGYTVMGRMSLLIGRVQFLMFEWLKVPQ